MENMGEKFIGEKYNDLNASTEVERAVETSKEKVPEKKAARIEAYFKRLEKIAEGKNDKKDKRGLRLLNHKITKQFTIDVTDQQNLTEMAKSQFELEKKIAIEQGRSGDLEWKKIDINNLETLAKYKDEIIKKQIIQKESLEEWFKYLEVNETHYPMWFRYYILRSIKDMGQFDRDTKSYSNRTEKTTVAFPEMNPEALGFAYRSLQEELYMENMEPSSDELEQLEKIKSLPAETDEELRKKVPKERLEEAKIAALKKYRAEKRNEFLEQRRSSAFTIYVQDIIFDEDRRFELRKELKEKMKSKDFSQLYAFAQVETTGRLDRSTTEGIWVKYNKGSNPKLLENSLKKKGTGWCTATGAAPDQLAHGDFYVYYTLNSETGKPTEPRIAIRMENDRIGEVRGVNRRQEIEPQMLEIAKEKYMLFKGAEKYEKAERDMQQLTEMYNRSFIEDKKTKEKTFADIPFSEAELEFLYERKRPIESFGWIKDPRIREIKEKRDKRTDYARMLGVERDQLTFESNDITEKTIVHFGDLTRKDYKILHERKGPLVIEGDVKLSNFPLLNKIGGLITFNGDADFRECKSLTELGPGLVFNGKTDFEGCISLKNIPPSIVFNGDTSFKECTKLEKINSGGMFEKDVSFRSDRSIKYIPDYVYFNGKADFRGCTSLLEISQKTIFNKAVDFTDCVLLQKLPSNMKFSGDANFEGCAFLSDIPQNTVFHGRALFFDCTSLHTISEGVVFGNEAVFDGCENLIQIFPDVKFNGDASFTGCSKLLSIPANMVFQGNFYLRNANAAHRIMIRKIRDEGRIKGKLFG